MMQRRLKFWGPSFLSRCRQAVPTLCPRQTVSLGDVFMGTS